MNSGHKRALPSFTPGLLKVEGKSAKAQQRDPLNRQLAAIKQTKFYIPLASFKKFKISLLIQLDQHHAWLPSSRGLGGFEAIKD